MSTHKLLDAVTTATAGDPISLPTSGVTVRTFQATVTGTGAVSATVVIEVSNDGVWLTHATITLSGTDSASDGGVTEAAWEKMRARVAAISGTGAAVTCIMGA